MNRKQSITSRIWVLTLVAGASAAPAAEKRHLDYGDLASLRDVSDPQLSPEGEWIAYVVRTTNLEKDRRYGDIWMASWDGARTVQLTHTADQGESKPRFSPDGRYLSFLAARAGGDESGHAVEDGGLAGAVRAEKGDDLSRAHLERDVPEHLEVSVRDREALDAQHG